MVTDRYLNVYHHETPEALAAWAAEQATSSAGADGFDPLNHPGGTTSFRMPIIGIDNIPGSVAMETFTFPATSAILVFGQESTGLTPAMQAACDVVVHITQEGSTRSMNAGAAASIAMYAWTNQRG
jgi:hypothetical protein